MTLQEADAKLTELNEKIDILLKERENVLKEWSAAFYAENPENIVCIDENTENYHELYLIQGDFKMFVCRFYDFDMDGSLDDFYKVLNNSIQILDIVNRRESDLPDDQKNLIYAKAMEIRENYQKKSLV